MGRMNYKDVKVNLKEIDEFKKKNAEERLKFIDFWVNYIKKHSDEEWSEQQAIVINSQINSDGKR